MGCSKSRPPPPRRPGGLSILGAQVTRMDTTTPAKIPLLRSLADEAHVYREAMGKHVVLLSETVVEQSASLSDGTTQPLLLPDNITTGDLPGHVSRSVTLTINDEQTSSIDCTRQGQASVGLDVEQAFLGAKASVTATRKENISEGSGELDVTMVIPACLLLFKETAVADIVTSEPCTYARKVVLGIGLAATIATKGGSQWSTSEKSGSASVTMAEDGITAKAGGSAEWHTGAGPITANVTFRGNLPLKYSDVSGDRLRDVVQYMEGHAERALHNPLLWIALFIGADVTGRET
eukprot:NODE_1309_length_1179_cov_375.156584.p1 GENE.NODE_1309_length_1179_cov_375.156584~~NODE_1309_length_1179_cov_375.156584.p1  ORF type:complete len:314 (-),score=37.18 NODE_1309_length_1179_cov_375.156584:220-1098(-)